MSDTQNDAKLCMKPYIRKGNYVCALCGFTYQSSDSNERAAPGESGFLNGKVFVEGTDNPVCEACCERHAPYLYTLWRLEAVLEVKRGV